MTPTGIAGLEGRLGSFPQCSTGSSQASSYLPQERLRGPPRVCNLWFALLPILDARLLPVMDRAMPAADAGEDVRASALPARGCWAPGHRPRRRSAALNPGSKGYVSTVRFVTHLARRA